jgi:hypothetical protein
MDKERFLRLEHARILASGEFVTSEWRDSEDRFVADLWDMTYSRKGGRYLAPKDRSLGYVRDNVEFHFDGPARRLSSAKSLKPRMLEFSPITKTVQTKATNLAKRNATKKTPAPRDRRRRVAEQALAWDRRRKGGE